MDKFLYKMMNTTQLYIDPYMDDFNILVGGKDNYSQRVISLRKLALNNWVNKEIDLSKTSVIFASNRTARIIYEQYIKKQRKSKIRKINESNR